MIFCPKCGTPMEDDAVMCPQCGTARGAAPVFDAKPDKVSIGLCILSFFIPLFGIIYWPVKHKETPKRAMACGIVAIVSWVLSLISSIASAAMMASVLASLGLMM